MVGTRGLGGFAGLLFGSVSPRLAAHTRGPLLVVRGNHRSAGRGEVLLGLESDADADAVVFAFAEAERRGVRLRMWHTAVRRRGTPAPPALIPADRVRDDAVVRALTEQAAPRRAGSHLVDASRDAALVVVGRRSRRTPVGAHIGPVTQAVLHHAAAPVAVVPHD